MLKITIGDDEIIVGTPNYVSTEIAEIRLADGTFRTVSRADITRIEGAKR
jgi:hypothetical protein